MKSLLILMSIVFVAMTVVNLYYMLVKGTYPYRPVSRDTITDVSETPRVVGHRIVTRGVLELQLTDTKGATSWTVTPDEGDPYETETAFPQVKMLNREHTFGVVSKNGAGPGKVAFTFTVDYCPTEVYAAAGQTHPDDNYFISKISIPVWPNETHSLDAWCGWDLKPEELAEAARLVADVKQEGMSTLELIDALGKRLLDNLDDKRGIPTDAIQQATPLETYRMALEGESGIWCSNFMSIYYLFSNAIGIRTRQVSVGGMIGIVKYSGHGFCESYIPEQDRWANVDINSRMFAITDRDGQVLNTIDLSEVLQANSIDLQVSVYRDGEIQAVPYADVCQPHRYYFTENCYTFYRLPDVHKGKLKQYLNKPTTLIQTNHDVPYDYTQRMILVWLWAVALVGLIASLGTYIVRR
jgi:hypothetical protein